MMLETMSLLKAFSNATELPQETLLEEDPYPFEKFAPTLSQCYCIVALGYLMARLEIMSASDVKGVNVFASYFAMPGIICVSLADSNFQNFRWELLTGIFVGKLIIFVLVAGVLLHVHGNIGVAGLVAVFCVHSNDLPVGNPLISSLYNDLRPQMMKYLFLIPAMTVIFFIPIGNVMVTIERLRKSNERLQCKNYSWKEILQELLNQKALSNEICNILRHPVVIATALGLILNCIFKGSLPEVLHQPIKVAATTIPGIALMLLGFSFVRKERYFATCAVVPAIALVFLKMVFTPILLHTLLKVLTTDSKLLSDFALLYGIVSPATAVFQFGDTFRKPLAVMSVTLIVTSFICFPVSYVIAKCTFVTSATLNLHVPDLKDVFFWVACMSIFCDIIVLIVMTCKNQWRQVHNCYILCLILTQLLTSLGVIVWNFAGSENWALYLKMVLFCGGEISGYLWTGILAVALVSKEKYLILSKKRFTVLFLIVFSLSILLTLILCVLAPDNDERTVLIVGRIKSNFELLQAIMTTIWLFICVIVVDVCMILHFKRNNDIGENKELQTLDIPSLYVHQHEEKSDLNVEKMKAAIPSNNGASQSFETQVYYETAVKDDEKTDLFAKEREWTVQTSSLLLVLSMILMLRCVNHAYRLIPTTSYEITVPLEYLQTLFIGQGILFLFIFGMDVRTIIISLRKRLSKSRQSPSADSSSSTNKPLRSEVSQFCRQFDTFYYTRCFRRIARERSWKTSTYKDSFWGHQLVDWLIAEGLCLDDDDAEEAAQKLLDGDVIRHALGSRGFYDTADLYYFTKKMLCEAYSGHI